MKDLLILRRMLLRIIPEAHGAFLQEIIVLPARQPSLVTTAPRPLTQRERQVMSLLLDGLPNKLIAHTLGISIRTVEVHRARVLSKMGVRNAVELAGAIYSQQMASVMAEARSRPSAHVLNEPDRPTSD
jgi:DNA-binding NarL/FixJ family response regulator